MERDVIQGFRIVLWRLSLTRQQLTMIWCCCVKTKPAAVKTKASETPIIPEMQALVYASVLFNRARDDRGTLIVA